MIPPVEGVVAVAPVLDLEALQLRLLGLRAEIDAILMQLSPLAAPARQEEPLNAAAAEMSTVLEPTDVAPAQAAEIEDASVDLDAAAPSEERAGGLNASAATAIVTQDPDSVPSTIDASAAASEATSGGSHLAPIASIEKPNEQEPNLAVNANAAPSITVCATPDAVAPLTSVGDAIAVAQETGTAPAEAPGVAPALDVVPRRRTDRASLIAASPVAPVARSRRRVAARIAAGIVMVVAAGTALVLAGGGALGRPHAWVSQLPSEIPWLSLGQHKRDENISGAGLVTVGRAAADEQLLSRYREVWPISP